MCLICYIPAPAANAPATTPLPRWKLASLYYAGGGGTGIMYPGDDGATLEIHKVHNNGVRDNRENHILQIARGLEPIYERYVAALAARKPVAIHTRSGGPPSGTHPHRVGNTEVAVMQNGFDGVAQQRCRARGLPIGNLFDTQLIALDMLHRSPIWIDDPAWQAAFDYGGRIVVMSGQGQVYTNDRFFGAVDGVQYANVGAVDGVQYANVYERRRINDGHFWSSTVYYSEAGYRAALAPLDAPVAAVHAMV